MCAMSVVWVIMLAVLSHSPTEMKMGLNRILWNGNIGKAHNRQGWNLPNCLWLAHLENTQLSSDQYSSVTWLLPVVSDRMWKLCVEMMDVGMMFKSSMPYCILIMVCNPKTCESKKVSDCWCDSVHIIERFGRVGLLAFLELRILTCSSNICG